MIRSLLRLSTALVLSALLVMCSKKEETLAAATPAQLVQGKWRLSGLLANPAIKVKVGSFPASPFTDLFGAAQIAYPCISTVTLTLTSNTTQLNTPTGCTFTDEQLQQQLGVSLNGVYTITGNKLELTANNGMKTTYDLTVGDGNMTWSYQNKFRDPDAPADPTKAIDSKVKISFVKAL